MLCTARKLKVKAARNLTASFCWVTRQTMSGRPRSLLTVQFVVVQIKTQPRNKVSNSFVFTIPTTAHRYCFGWLVVFCNNNPSIAAALDTGATVHTEH